MMLLLPGCRSWMPSRPPSMGNRCRRSPKAELPASSCKSSLCPASTRACIQMGQCTRPLPGPLPPPLRPGGQVEALTCGNPPHHHHHDALRPLAAFLDAGRWARLGRLAPLPGPSAVLQAVNDYCNQKAFQVMVWWIQSWSSLCLWELWPGEDVYRSVGGSSLFIVLTASLPKTA